MMPKVLWETTLNPRTRRLLRVEISDQIVTDRVINELMGKDASARFRFIMERAEEAQALNLRERWGEATRCAARCHAADAGLFAVGGLSGGARRLPRGLSK